MKTIIRHAVKEDYEALATLYREVHEFHAKGRPDLFQINAVAAVVEESLFDERLASSSSLYLIAEADGQPAGFALVIFKQRPAWSTIPASAEIDAIAVTQFLRGSGIGKALLAASEAWASEKGAAYLSLGVHAFNTRAQSLYQEFGFEVEQVKMGKFLPPSTNEL